MRASFSIDGLHELEITGNVPSSPHDPTTVCINLLKTPLPVKQNCRGFHFGHGSTR